MSWNQFTLGENVNFTEFCKNWKLFLFWHKITIVGNTDYYTFTYMINAFCWLLKISRFTFSVNWIWRIETPSTAIGCETRWAIVPRLTCDALLCRGFAIFINPWLALAILVIWNISWKHEAFLKKKKNNQTKILPNFYGVPQNFLHKWVKSIFTYAFQKVSSKQYFLHQL